MPFHRQLNVLLGGRQPTKGRLAQVTSRFVEYFIVSFYVCCVTKLVVNGTSGALQRTELTVPVPIGTSGSASHRLGVPLQRPAILRLRSSCARIDHPVQLIIRRR